MPIEPKTLKQKRAVALKRMQIIAPLWRMNYSEREIREIVMKKMKLKVLSSATVHKDIQRLLEEYKAERLDNVEERVTAELARTDLVITQAWEQWEQSKKDRNKEKVTKRKKMPDLSSEGGDQEFLAMVQNEKDTIIGKGDPRYLDIVLKALDQRRRLLGLDKVQVDANVQVGGEIEITHTSTGFSPATSEDEVRRRDGIKEM